MNVRLTSISELQFLFCLKHELWGSTTPRFQRWNAGDRLVFIVDKAIAAVSEISGAPFQSTQRVWDSVLFPHRIPLHFISALLPGKRPPFPGQFADDIGPNWGLVVLNKVPLPEPLGEAIVNCVTAVPNDLEIMRRDIDKLIVDAKRVRDLGGHSAEGPH